MVLLAKIPKNMSLFVFFCFFVFKRLSVVGAHEISKQVEKRLKEIAAKMVTSQIMPSQALIPNIQPGCSWDK
jgi:hypothetical protein